MSTDPPVDDGEPSPRERGRMLAAHGLMRALARGEHRSGARALAQLRRRRWFMVAIPLAAAASLALAVAWWTYATRVERPVLEAVQGSVVLAGQAARDGDRLAPGSLLTITDLASARVIWKDGTRLDLGGGSDATLLAERAKRVRVTRGRATATVAPQPAGRAFAIDTPHGRASVLGTRFTVIVGAAATEVTVERGRVAVAAPDGARTEVAAGERATLAADRIPAPVSGPRPLPAIAPESFGAVGDGVADDGAALHAAIATATAADGRLGMVRLRAGATYRITSTWAISGTFGGVLDGAGATIAWDGDATGPALAMIDARETLVRSLRITAQAHLATAVAIDPGDSASPSGHDALRDVDIDGAGRLDVGVRFSSRSDLPSVGHLLERVSVSGYRDVGVLVAHNQARYVRLVDCHFEAGPGGRACVRADRGSFSVAGGSGSGSAEADFLLVQPSDGIDILGWTSRGSRRLLETAGPSGAPLPVRVEECTFAADALAPDRQAILMAYAGPLLVRGCRFGDAVGPRPVIALHANAACAASVIGNEFAGAHPADDPLLVTAGAGPFTIEERDDVTNGAGAGRVEHRGAIWRGSLNASAATGTCPAPLVAALPASCTLGEVAVVLTAERADLWLCAADGRWTAVEAGARSHGGSAPPAPGTDDAAMRAADRPTPSPTRADREELPVVGAVGDGVADDTAALQRALDDAVAPDGTRTTLALSPCASYRLTATLRARGGRGGGIDGRNARLVWDGPADVPAVAIDDSDGFACDELRVVSQPGHPLAVGVALRHAMHATLRRCEIQGTDAGGLGIGISAGRAAEVLLQDVAVRNHDRVGVEIADGGSARLERLTLEAAAGAAAAVGVHCRRGSFALLGGEIAADADAGVVIDDATAPVTIRGVLVLGCARWIVSNSTAPVTVIGGRHAPGRTLGPAVTASGTLTIEGIELDGDARGAVEAAGGTTRGVAFAGRRSIASGPLAVADEICSIRVDASGTAAGSGVSWRSRFDLAAVGACKPAPVGATLPGRCRIGELFFLTATTPGRNLHICLREDAWTTVGAGGGDTVRGTGARTGPVFDASAADASRLVRCAAADPEGARPGDWWLQDDAPASAALRIRLADGTWASLARP